MLVKVIAHLKVGAQKKTRIKQQISSFDHKGASYQVSVGSQVSALTGEWSCGMHHEFFHSLREGQLHGSRLKLGHDVHVELEYKSIYIYTTCRKML